MTLPLLGADRHALVDQLLSLHDQTISSDRPLLVTLEAASGWGKTRIVQELYARLAAERQEKPAYWPAAVIPDDPAVGLVHVPRKHVYPPSFDAPAHAIPAYFWWGISATARRDGSPVQALVQDVAQIEAHGGALDARWRRSVTRRRRVRRTLTGETARSVGAAGMEEVAATALEQFTNIAVPGFGLAIVVARITADQRHRWSKRDQPAQFCISSDTSEDTVERLATELSLFAEAAMPIVVVVEDAHDADAALVDLLVRLLRGHGPVMVIATAWPGLLEERDRPCARLLGDVQDERLQRFHGSALAPLAAHDLAAVVRHHVPDAEPRAVRALTHRLTNPLAVELAVSVERVRNALVTGDVGDLESLPRQVNELYTLVWRTLPKRVQEALVLAAVAIPSQISSLVGSETWDADLLSRATAGVDWIERRSDELLATLADTTSAYGWVASVTGWVQRFMEPAQRQTAAAEANDFLSAKQRQRVLEALARHISWEPDEPERARANASLLVALASEGFVPWDSHVIAAVDHLIAEARSLLDPDSLSQVVALASAVPTDVDDSTARLSRQRSKAGALIQLGRTDEAVETLSAVIDGLSGILGPDHRQTLAVRAELLNWTSPYDPTPTAALATEAQSTLGRDDPDVVALWLRVAVQRLVQERGKQAAAHVAERLEVPSPPTATTTVDATIRNLQTTIEEAARSLGDDHAAVLNARQQVGFELADLGRHEEAIPHLAKAHAAAVLKHGPQHPNSLIAEVELLNARALAGDTEALTSMRSAIDCYVDLYGESSPNIKAFRDRLVWAQTRHGEIDEDLLIWFRQQYRCSIEETDDHTSQLHFMRMLSAGIVMRESAGWPVNDLLERHLTKMIRRFGVEDVWVSQARAYIDKGL